MNGRASLNPGLIAPSFPKAFLSLVEDLSTMAAELDLAEILDESGAVKFRYQRHLGASGERWVRHGLFRAYHRNGELATEGHYRDGVEEGVWTDFHENGVTAAQGEYRGGKEYGRWRYWDSDGRETRAATFHGGDVGSDE